jgi:hypothetical protein
VVELNSPTCEEHTGGAPGDDDDGVIELNSPTCEKHPFDFAQGRLGSAPGSQSIDRNATYGAETSRILSSGFSIRGSAPVLRDENLTLL